MSIQKPPHHLTPLRPLPNTNHKASATQLTALISRYESAIINDMSINTTASSTTPKPLLPFFILNAAGPSSPSEQIKEDLAQRG